MKRWKGTAKLSLLKRPVCIIYKKRIQKFRGASQTRRLFTFYSPVLFTKTICLNTARNQLWDCQIKIRKVSKQSFTNERKGTLSNESACNLNHYYWMCAENKNAALEIEKHSAGIKMLRDTIDKADIQSEGRTSRRDTET